MADRLSAYADWLVANQNKRGTPEFDQVANAYKQLRQPPVDRSFGSALQQGLDAPFENMAQTARMLGAEGTADTLSGLTDAPVNYESAAERFINPREGDVTVGGFGIEYLPRAAVEQIGQYGGSIATRAGGGLVGGLLTGGNPAGVAGGAYAGPALFQFVQQLGPIAQERARNNGRDEPEWDDWSAAAAAAGVSAALNSLGVSGGPGKSLLNRILREGVTEGSQSVVEQTGGTAATEAGLDINPKQAVGEGIIGGTTAGGVDAAGKTASLLTGGRSNATDQEAAGDFSRRLGGIVEANNLNLSNLDKTSTTGARQAVDIAHSQIGADMRQLIKDLKVKLKVDRLDPAETVADKVLSEAGTAEARTKTKSVVGQQEYDATERLVGDTAEGQRLLRLFRESNELTRLHNSGYVGGLSQYTDQLSPLSSNVGYTARSAAELPTRLLGTAAGYTLNPAIPATQLAAVGTGRAVDALTGRRSRVRKYIRDNQANPGVDIGNQPSLREQAIIQDEDKRQREDALRQDMLNFNDPPKGSPTDPNPSPEYIMQSETGLDRDGVEQALQIVANTRPKLKKAVESYREMLRKGTQVDDLNFLIPAVKTAVRQNADQFNTQQINPASQTNQTTESEGYKRGIEANRKFVDNLINKLEADTTLSTVDKQLTRQALDQMQLDVGIDPVGTVNQLMDEAVGAAQNKPKVQSYLQPYVDRVERQQKASGPRVNRQRSFDADRDLGPALAIPDTFGIGDDIDTTILPIYPTEGSKPAGDVAMSLNEGVQWLHDRWKKSTGRTEPFEYTPENIERIAKMMAAEAERALQDDTNAIGWYDRKLKAAKAVLALVEPRIFDNADNEAAFDLALAVTSNGAAVTDNFANAVEVFRDYLNTGKMPADTWKKGGERNQAMVEAFQFYNAYQAARLNTPFQDFMDADFAVRDLVDFIDRFNEANGTNISLSVSENMDTVVKGSFVLGAKIGQGFYQNIRGNYDPLTMDIWWMRMWNRLVGRPFAESKKSDMVKNRKKVAEIVKQAFKPKSGLDVEKQLIRETLDRLGENRRGLYGDPARMDAFITALDSRWQSYFKRYQKENGKNPPKPQLFKTTGTHTKNIKGKLQATPAGGGERQVMRDATARAIELLAGIGYNIDTADFQALMWYPEKRLFRSLGVKGGRGEDNDYLDAAIILAKEEGISDDKIQEALPDSERGGVNPEPSAAGQNGSVRSGTRGSADQASPSPNVSRQRSFDFEAQGDQGLQQTPRVVGSRAAEPEEVREFLPTSEALFEIGKPGSPYENGIQDMETAQKLAEALGYAFRLVGNEKELSSYLDEDMSDSIGGLSAFDSPNSFMFDRGQQVKGKIGVLSRTPLEALYTALHEVGHGIERDFVPGRKIEKEQRIPFFHRPFDGKVKYTVGHELLMNTPRGEISMLMTLAQMDTGAAKDIIDEIINAQKTGILVSQTNESTPVREMYPKIAELKDRGLGDYYSAYALENELTYLQTPAELAADLFGIYLFDPAYAKRIMPNATKLVRKLMKENKTVTFYSIPFAALIAAILANMAVADGEEEEQRGILSLGQGALTA